MARDDTMVMELRLRLDKAERELARFVKKAERTQINLKGIDHRKFTQPLGKITGSVSEFQKSLEASNARVIAFTASAGVLFTVTKAFQEMARATINVEKNLQDINVIMGATSRNLKQFGNELFNVAKNTGQSFDEVAQAATEFARQGLTMEKTLIRTRDALILTRLSGMDATSAVNALTAAINSFSRSALTSTEIINRLANVDAAFAVSTNDLAEAIRRVGASADDVNVSFNELISVVTSVQQTTARGGNVIGNSLKTIFTRIQRTEVIDQLQTLGVTVRDMQGNMRPAMKVLQDFAKVYDKINPALKAQTAELVGGVYQMNILKSILKDLKSDYSIYNNALGVANNSTDEAIKRNEELNKTLSALINESIQGLTKIGAEAGKVTLEPLFRRILDGFNTLSSEIELFGDIGELFGFDREDASKFGKDLAGNIMKSIGNFLSGPGFIALGAIAGKLFLDFTKFLGKAVVDFASLNKTAQQQAVLQQQIQGALAANPALIDQITRKEITRYDAERKILDALKQEILLREQIERLAAGSGARAMAGGFGTKTSRSTGESTVTYKGASKGFIPNFSNMREYVGALAGGYKPGDIKKMFIKGEGNVTYNTAEKVKKFPGMEQEAIMPPEASEAGIAYKKKFSKTHGFDPYASGGFVPNLLNVLTSMRTIFDKKGKGSTGSMTDVLSASREQLMKSQGVPAWLQGVLGSALRPGEMVRIKTMGQLSGITSQERSAFATGTGKAGHLKGAQMESALAGRKGNFSWRQRFSAPGGTGELGKMPVDLGTKSKTGRNYPIESKPELKTKQIGQLFLKTLYENNSTSLKQLRSRLKSKADMGDASAGAHLDKLQSVIGRETLNRGKEISKYSAGGVNSLSDFNREVGFDSRNAAQALRERQRGLDVFSGGFIPNFKGATGRKKGKLRAPIMANAAMLVPEGASGGQKMATTTVPGTKTRYTYGIYEPDIPGGDMVDLEKQVRDAVTDIAVKYAQRFPNNPLNAKPEPAKYFNTGAMRAATGSVFEAAIDAAFLRSKDVETSRWDVKKGTKGAKAVRDLFGVPGVMNADYKVSTSQANRASMAHKIHGDQKSAGFIPNFAALEDAFNTERSMGGDPVLDFQSGVGFYVRDGKTQKNFGDVLKDHPEGIGRAIKNSKSMQEALAAEGHVPNFAEGGTGFDMTIITGGMMMLGTAMMQFSDTNKQASVAAEELRQQFTELDAHTEQLDQALGDATRAQKRHQDAVEADASAIKAKEKELESRGKKSARTKEAKNEAIDEINEDRRKRGKAELTKAEKSDLKKGKGHSSTQRAFDKRMQRIQEEKEQAIRDEIKSLRESKEANIKSARAEKDKKKSTEELKRAQAKRAKELSAQASAHNVTATGANQVGVGRDGVKSATTMQKFGTRMQGLAMPAMMGMPIVGGLARTAGVNEQAVSGVESGVNIAAMGAMTGNPYAALAGGIAGLGVAAAGALNAMNDPLPALKKNAEEAKERFTKLSNASQTYLTAFDKLEEGMKSESIKPEDLVKQQDALSEAFMDLPEDIRAKFAHVKGDAESIKKFFMEANKELQDSQRRAEGRVQFGEMYDEERGWFVDGVRDFFGAEEKGDRMFGEGRAGNKRQTDYANLLFREVDKDKLKGAEGTATLDAVSSFVDSIGNNMSADELDQMARHMQELGIPQGYIDDFRAVAKNSEDGAEAAKDLAKNLKDTKEAMVKTAQATAQIAVNKAIGDQYRETLKKISDQQKSVNAALKTTMEIEKMRIDQMNSLRLSRDNFQLDLGQILAQGSFETSKPFMGKVETSRVETDLKLAKMRADEIKKIREAVTKTNTAAFNVTQAEVMKAAQTLQSSIAGKVGQQETNKIWKDVQQNQHIVAQLTPIMVEHLQKIKDNPDAQALPEKLRAKLEEAFSKAGSRNAQASANVIMKQLEKQTVALQGDLQKIFNETAQQSIIMGLQQRNQEESIRLQEKLASFGGGAGFVGRGQFGETNLSGEFQKVKEDLYNAILPLVDQRAAGVAGAQESQPGMVDAGRAAFNTLDALINKMALRREGGERMGFGDFAPLTGRAVAGRAETIRMDVAQARNVAALQGADVSEGSELGKAFKAAEDGAEDTAIMQIAKEFKFDEMPDQMAQMNERMGIMNEIIANQASDLEQRNKASFTAALQAVGVDKLADNFNQDIVEQTNKLGQQTVDSAESNAKAIVEGGLKNLDGVIARGNVIDFKGYNQVSDAISDGTSDSNIARAKVMTGVTGNINSQAVSNFQNLSNTSTEVIGRPVADLANNLPDDVVNLNRNNAKGFNLLLAELQTLNRLSDAARGAKEKKDERLKWVTDLTAVLTERNMDSGNYKDRGDAAKAAGEEAKKMVEDGTMLGSILGDTPGSQSIAQAMMDRDKKKSLENQADPLAGFKFTPEQQAEATKTKQWNALRSTYYRGATGQLEGDMLEDTTIAGYRVGRVNQSLEKLGLAPESFRNIDEMQAAVAEKWDTLSRSEKVDLLNEAEVPRSGPSGRGGDVAQQLDKIFDKMFGEREQIMRKVPTGRKSRSGKPVMAEEGTGRYTRQGGADTVMNAFRGGKVDSGAEWWLERTVKGIKQDGSAKAQRGQMEAAIRRAQSTLSGVNNDKELEKWVKQGWVINVGTDQVPNYQIKDEASMREILGQMEFNTTSGYVPGVSANYTSAGSLNNDQLQMLRASANRTASTENIDRLRELQRRFKAQQNQGPDYKADPDAGVDETASRQSLSFFGAFDPSTYQENDKLEAEKLERRRQLGGKLARQFKKPIEMFFGARGAGASGGQYRVGEEGFNRFVDMATTQYSGAVPYDTQERQLSLRRNQNLLAYTRRQNLQLGTGYAAQRAKKAGFGAGDGSVNIYRDLGAGKQLDVKRVEQLSKLAKGEKEMLDKQAKEMEDISALGDSEESRNRLDKLFQKLKTQGYTGDDTDVASMSEFIENAGKDVQSFANTLDRVKEYGKTFATAQQRIQELKAAQAGETTLSQEDILKAYGVDQMEKARVALDEWKKKIDLIKNDPTATAEEYQKAIDEGMAVRLKPLIGEASEIGIKTQTLKELIALEGSANEDARVIGEKAAQILVDYTKNAKDKLDTKIKNLDNAVMLDDANPTLYADERRANRRARTKARMRDGSWTMEDTMGDIKQAWSYGNREMARDAEESLFNISQNFQNETVNAFQSLIDGTKSAKEAFGDLTQGIADMAMKMLIEMAVKRYIFNPMAGMFGREGGLVTDGGIQKFSKGGAVLGGSGTKDDVPAMLSSGEFVLRKQAVNKYGMGFLNTLNSGSMPPSGSPDPQANLDSLMQHHASKGGVYSKFNLRNAFVYDSDKPTGASHYAIDNRLSRQAITDPDNPRNQIRMDKVQNLYDYWADRRTEIDEWRKSVDEYNKNKKKRMRNMLYLAGGLAAFGAITGAGATFGKGALGGKLGLWAASKGGYNKRDDIPAMLMGGEYVVNSDTVNRYGVDFFRNLNAGKLNKYADGGYVGAEPANTAETASDQASGAVNNVTINVSVEGSGGITSSTSGMSQEDGKVLADLIKDQVVKTLITEKRSGGILANN